MVGYPHFTYLHMRARGKAGERNEWCMGGAPTAQLEGVRGDEATMGWWGGAGGGMMGGKVIYHRREDDIHKTRETSWDVDADDDDDICTTTTHTHT